MNRRTRQEWRELGFFYDRDGETRIWKLIGSRACLLRFRDELLLYVANPKNALKSEHGRYGPYSYLEIMTWPEAGFDDHAIRGPLEDFNVPRFHYPAHTRLCSKCAKICSTPQLQTRNFLLKTPLIWTYKSLCRGFSSRICLSSSTKSHISAPHLALPTTPIAAR